jgi:hypothetical protein
MLGVGAENATAGFGIVGVALAIIAEGDHAVKGKTIQIEVLAGYLAPVRPGGDFTGADKSSIE